MKTLKVIGNVSFVFLAMIAIFIDCFFVYYKYINQDITIGTNYIDNQLAIDLVDSTDLTEEEVDEYEERYFLTANYFDNSNENGIKLRELRFDYFSDYSLTENAYLSTGMQYVGDFSLISQDVTNEQTADNYVVSDFYYYDTTNDISFEGKKISTTLNRNTQFTIKIDDRAFSIQLTGKKEIYAHSWFYGDYLESILYYSYASVFNDVFNAIETNSVGYGDFYITVDLSEYFTIREYDTETGKFLADDVSNIIKNYSVLKFHYEDNGARASSQSLFGIIECNPSYDLTEDDVDTTYWQERFVYTLTVDNLVYRYSDVYEGYFVSLNLETKNLFNSMSRAKVKVNIDLNFDEDKNIVGLDYNAFENFKLDSLKITGEPQTLYLLDKCLYDTEVVTIEHSSGIVFDIALNALNNEYVEVVL